MVDYQGPKAIRRLVEAFEIPIFNRVRELNYDVRDLSENPLRKQDVARLHKLERIWVTRRGAKPVDKAEIRAAESVVPACRLANVKAVSNQISIQVNPGSQFACCSP